MVKDNNASAMEMSIQAVMKMENHMDTESIAGLLEIHIKVIFTKDPATVKGDSSSKGLSTKANSKKTLNTEKELKNILMDSNSKVNFYKDNDIKGSCLQVMEVK